MFPRLADRLARAGFLAVSFNFSGSGVSGGDEFDEPERWYRQKPSADLEDLRTVVDYLAANGSQWIALLGHSRGGGIAVLHAAADPRVRALATWAAISTVERWSAPQRSAWRAAGVHQVLNSRTGQVLPQYTDVLDDIERNGEALDIESAAGRIAVPWLIVHGRQDEAVPVLEGERLAEAAPRATSRFLPVDGAGHTFGAAHPWRGPTPELESVMDATLAFFAAELR